MALKNLHSLNRQGAHCLGARTADGTGFVQDRAAGREMVLSLPWQWSPAPMDFEPDNPMRRPRMYTAVAGAGRSLRLALARSSSRLTTKVRVQGLNELMANPRNLHRVSTLPSWHVAPGA